jgi:hypothetical protein
MKIHPMSKTFMSFILIIALSLSDLFASAALAQWKFDESPKRIPPKVATKSLRTPPTVPDAKTSGLAPEPVETIRARAAETYGKMPLSFEANRGQADAQVKFLSRGGGYTLFLTSSEAVWVSRRSAAAFESRPEATRREKRETHRPTGETVLRMRLAGANPAPHIEGEDQLPGKSNYFIGNDPQSWRADVPTYAKVKYEAVYPGIDLIYHSDRRQLEYDFVVAPGAAPKAIKLAFQGADKLEINTQGDLVLHTSGGEMIQRAPVIYQESDGIRKIVPGRYQLRGRNQVGFRVDDYDASRPLIIDPVVLGYSTYLGGGGNDKGRAIFVDPWGYAYVTGETTSTDFPQRLNAYTAGNNNGSPTTDAFVSIFQPTGWLIQTTYFGGTGDDQGNGIGVDVNGRVYVVGSTTSSILPNTLPPTFSGQNAFVATFAPIGTLAVAAINLGGDIEDWGNGIALDANGLVYVTGTTYSTNFPTVGALQATNAGFGDAFVARVSLTATGLSLDYSTYLGGGDPDGGNGIAVDSSGNAYVTGYTYSTNFQPVAGTFQPAKNAGADAFVTKLNPTGSSLVYWTYLGGNGHDEATGIDLDSSGNAHITGFTDSLDSPITPVYEGFPILNAYQNAHSCGFDGFVTKLNSTGSALVYSTYLGGCYDDYSHGIAVDSNDFAYVTGGAGGCDFPQLAKLATAPPSNCTNSSADAFVAKFGATGSLVYSTLLGGSSTEVGLGIAVTSDGTAYVTGFTSSTNFPLVAASQLTLGGSPALPANWDAFVATVRGTPNLRVTSLSSAPASITVGTGFNMKDTTENSGIGPAGASTTRFRLSTDNIVTMGTVDLLLSANRSVPVLLNGAISKGITTVNIPTTVTHGYYYLGACADDGTSAVDESNESDNCMVAASRVLVVNPQRMADLVISVLSTPTNIVAPAGSLHVTDWTSNPGTGSTVTPTTTEYRLSSDATITSADLRLGSRSVPIVLASSKSIATVLLTIPATVARGNYFLGACADAGNVSVEKDETNNCRVIAIQVQ